MSRISLVEGQLAAHQKILDSIARSDTGYVSAFTRLKAEIMALSSIVAELAQQSGIPLAEYQQHTQLRTAHFLDRFLADAERQNPALGAALDDRQQADVPTDRGFPPLFPENPSK